MPYAISRALASACVAVAVILAAAIGGTASAGSFEDARAAYKAGDYVTAARLLQPLAEQGDAFAQYQLGEMYGSGHGVPNDLAQSTAFIRQAAEQGLAIAQQTLGIRYDTGLGVPQDHAQAAIWFRRAADQGDVISQHILGQMYLEGWGVPQDYGQAAEWFRKAADQGLPVAQDSLGIMYAYGAGVPQDYVQAHKWFNLAASKFDASQKERRDEAVKHRDHAAAKMTAVQIAQAQKLAREWQPK